MPKFNITLTRPVFYEATITAKDKIDAEEVAAQIIDAGQVDEFLVHRGDVEIVSIQPATTK